MAALAATWSWTACAQTPAETAPPPLAEIVFVCPFDRTVRSRTPGECTRRGRSTALVAEVPEPLEFPVVLATRPQILRPAEIGQLRFTVRDPWEGKLVERFTIVHERPLHVFLVSEDLDYFLHDHPRWDRGGFTLPVRLPRSGHYRALADFLPEAATPQLAAKSVFVAGSRMPAPVLEPDYSPKKGANLTIALDVAAADPMAGASTTLHFDLSPETGLEPYLGAPGHLFAASDDLIDLVHAHPIATEPAPTVIFQAIFPRPRTYRVWAQFQREGTVNTVHFDVRVRSPGG
jgi:hypothetical protein